jgi:hypothetical protein
MGKIAEMYAFKSLLGGLPVVKKATRGVAFYHRYPSPPLFKAYIPAVTGIR